MDNGGQASDLAAWLLPRNLTGLANQWFERIRRLPNGQRQGPRDKQGKPDGKRGHRDTDGGPERAGLAAKRIAREQRKRRQQRDDKQPFGNSQAPHGSPPTPDSPAEMVVRAGAGNP